MIAAVDDPSGVATALAHVRGRIARAAEAAGRVPDQVTLVAVSKTHPAAAVLAAMAAGQRCFGENRVQEATAKFAPMAGMAGSPTLHLIGPLQTNKVRDAVRIASCIETLDRAKLVRAIMDAIQAEGRCPDLLVQVNVGDEPQKAGISRAEADGFIAACRREFGPRLVGVMGIPPLDRDPRPHFRWLNDCAVRTGLPMVSMGMSNDFEIAIAEGATHVRVGSAIFGQRPPLAAG